MGADGRLGKNDHLVAVEIVMDGRIVGARFLLAFPRGRTPLVLPPKRKAARTWANFFFFLRNWAGDKLLILGGIAFWVLVTDERRAMILSLD